MKTHSEKLSNKLENEAVKTDLSDYTSKSGRITYHTRAYGGGGGFARSTNTD